ncbi:MAG: DUF6572 domain-containing protein [Planctomycetota bacterium]
MADPVQNLDQIDIAAKRKDGGIDLIIVTSSILSSSPDHQKLLLDKIESYLRQINSPEFQSEFGDAAEVRIIVDCVEKPDSIILQLLENASGWVEENNAELAIRMNK